MNKKRDTLNLSHDLLHDETDALYDLFKNEKPIPEIIKQRILMKLEALREDEPPGLLGALLKAAFQK